MNDIYKSAAWSLISILITISGIGASFAIAHGSLMLSSGVRVKGQSKNRMEVSPRNIRFKSFANRFAILLQTRLPQSRRLTGCIASAIDALHYT
jgi:hypothetical protein